MIDLEKNKATAKAFYDLMFNGCNPRKALELYSGATYIQHNPCFLFYYVDPWHQGWMLVLWQ